MADERDRVRVLDVPPKASSEGSAVRSASERDVLASAAAAARPVLLPRPVAIVELVALLAAIMLIDWVWPALEVHDLQPSPYWLPVLLLSAQYGTLSGAVAAIAAISCHFSFATFPEQGVGENEFAYRLRTLSQPILWIAAVLLLGQFRMQQIASKRDLARLAIDLDGQRTALAGYAQGLRSRCDRLERSIAGRPLDEARALLRALGELANHGIGGGAKPVGDALELVGNALRLAYPEASVSVFATREQGLTWVAGSRPLAGDLFLARLTRDHPIAQAMLDRPRTLRILQQADEGVLGNQGLVALPVMDASGRVVGMLKVDQAPARYLNDELETELSALAQAIAPHIRSEAARALPNVAAQRAQSA